ncbi:MAG TPA: MoaD/ThiS family protein [Halobacteriales archaeon]|jgi:molybdopterin synthase sulfur carrier subunit|uniref:ubiquitin-like small modifier protein 1 n=1 Tax=Candidatus Hikarchaeum yamanae TaxID=2675326 RepID=UPI0017EE8A60|nr:MoaD/ThiS family protein [Halobacteriales archaeon]HIJ12604.1 MoaD/ThiS family protein [Halobacteriales archaeon]|tara:strand:+ start:13934 stop:14209 length:276 start_codon:yes stop_codon:yes gene_type:complete
MKWKLFANFAEIAGEREIEIRMESVVTIEDALEDLFDQIPKLRELVMNEQGGVLNHVQVLCNGEEMRGEKFSQMALGNDDELAIIPPMSGG